MWCRIFKETSFSDFVVWPKSHSDVVQIVDLASEHGVVIIPFGGGTSVSLALECLPVEVRMIVSLDTSRMNRILWIDEKNWTASIEAGKVGKDLEAELALRNFCTGMILGHAISPYDGIVCEYVLVFFDGNAR